jgi:hypothetical protein
VDGICVLSGGSGASVAPGVGAKPSEWPVWGGIFQVYNPFDSTTQFVMLSGLFVQLVD